MRSAPEWTPPSFGDFQQLNVVYANFQLELDQKTAKLPVVANMIDQLGARTKRNHNSGSSLLTFSASRPTRCGGSLGRPGPGAVFGKEARPFARGGYAGGEIVADGGGVNQGRPRRRRGCDVP